jgi:putative mRNA 3-end processing factor
MDLISLSERGLYVEAGDFYIDPWQPVERAVLTHAHADHAYRGSKNYLVSKAGERLFRSRLWNEGNIETLSYGETRSIGGVKVSFHSAGHVLGSSQVRVEYKGEVWVASGDYKLTEDPTCAPFEHVKCHTFITEATFGLPIYRWTQPAVLFADVNEWWRANAEKGKASVIFAYSLGKAQRIVKSVDASIGKIYTHGAVERLTEEYRLSGVELPPTTYVGAVENKKDFIGSLVVAPPSAQDTPWLRKFGNASTAFASGWMRIRGARRRRAVDRGFILSDHADWDELLKAIFASEAEKILVTHGTTEPLVRYLQSRGVDARPLKTRYAGESPEIGLAGGAEIDEE